MEHYKSWSYLRKYLRDCLGDALKSRIDYFYTSYHGVHDVYSMAAIRLDGRNTVCFDWWNERVQAVEIAEETSRSGIHRSEAEKILQNRWNEECVLSEYDFLKAVLEFRNMSISDALNSDDYIIKVLAVVDRRTGKRTLAKISESSEYRQYPEWVQQFYRLRFEAEGII